MTFTIACKASELKPGELKGLVIAGKGIVLANVGGQVCALEGKCTHKGGPLDQGVLEGPLLTCPFHHAQFNCKNGKVEANLPPEYGQATPLRTYPVKTEGDDLMVDV